MKERPIPFRAQMVGALLDGSKTQTRRIVKGQAADWAELSDEEDVAGRELFVVCGAKDSRGLRPILTSVTCPYGQPGERLWVREAWRMLDTFDKDSGSRVAERCLDAGYSSPWAPIHYEADSYRRDWQHVGTPPHGGPPTAGRLRHARFMPRWASRILLEIVSVRVERLQDCSEEDARAEGIADGGCTNCGESETKCKCDFPMPDARDAYCHLWGQINGADSWAANPWVWVIAFKRVTP